MAYIGTSPQNGVRNRFVYAATQGQTAFTGADADSKTLVVSDQLYTDVYQNGVKLKLTTDWTATATTVTLVNAASADDVIEIVSFDVFSVSDTVPASTGGSFAGAISATSYGAVSGTTGVFSGDVGIGVASPTQKVTVDGGLLEVRSGNALMLRPTANNWDFRIKATGVNLDFHSGGNLTTPKVTILNAGGITFNGDTAAANALDDYEEGTWTVTDQSGAGMSLTVYVSTYTKIGNQVFFEIGMLFPSTSSTADLKLSLPFTAISSSDNTGGAFVTTTNSGRSDNFVVGRNTINLSGVNNNNVSAKNNNYSGNQLRCAGQYTTP